MRHLLSIVVLVATPLASHVAAAQTGNEASTTTPLAAWASLGAGLGGRDGASLFAGVARANLSYGSALVTVRATQVGQLIDAADNLSDRAILVGARTAGRRLFATGALGYASSRLNHSNDTHENGPGALAYDFGVHGDATYAGIAVSISGTAGPRSLGHIAFTLLVEVGGFGR